MNEQIIRVESTELLPVLPWAVQVSLSLDSTGRPVSVDSRPLDIGHCSVSFELYLPHTLPGLNSNV